MDPNYPPSWIGAALGAASLPVILPSPSASVRHLEEMWPLRLAHWWERPGTEQSVNRQPTKLKDPRSDACGGAVGWDQESRPPPQQKTSLRKREEPLRGIYQHQDQAERQGEQVAFPTSMCRVITAGSVLQGDFTAQMKEEEGWGASNIRGASLL